MKMYEVYDPQHPAMSRDDVFRTIEEAEKYIDSSWMEDANGRHPGSDYLAIRIVERASHPCKVCGQEVTAKDPVKYPYCRSCHYRGAPVEEREADTLAAFRAAFPDAEVQIQHTGGGCFWLRFDWTGEDRYYITTDGEAELPDPGKWSDGWGALCRYVDAEDGTWGDSDDETGDVLEPREAWNDDVQGYTVEEIIAAIRADRAERGLS